MYLVTKKELDLKKTTAQNILASNNPYLNKSKVIEFLKDLERIHNLRFTKITFLESRQEKKGYDRKGSVELA